MHSFTHEQFLAIFVRYNEAIWPVSAVGFVLAMIALAMLFWPSPAASRITAGILAAMWIWTGAIYHGLFFAPVNRAAYLFGLLFVAQGLIIFAVGVWRADLSVEFQPGPAAWGGVVLAVYAVVGYPLTSLAVGQAYPAMPMLGVTPGPVTIFTLSLLLLSRRPVSLWLLAVPLFWSLAGGTVALAIGLPEGWPLLVNGLVTIPLIMVSEDAWDDLSVDPRLSGGPFVARDASPSGGVEAARLQGEVVARPQCAGNGETGQMSSWPFRALAARRGMITNRASARPFAGSRGSVG